MMSSNPFALVGVILDPHEVGPGLHQVTDLLQPLGGRHHRDAALKAHSQVSLLESTPGSRLSSAASCASSASSNGPPRRSRICRVWDFEASRSLSRPAFVRTA